MLLIAASLPDTLWVSGSFIRESDDGRVSGYFYVKPAKITILRVVRPVNQIMYFLPDTLVIYYPEDRKVFKLRSSHRMLEGGMGTFGSAEENLKRAGFMFVSAKHLGDTLVKSYRHPQAKMTLRIYTLNGTMVKYLAFGPDGGEVLRVEFGGIRRVYDDYSFPDTIRTVMHTPGGTYRETYIFHGIAVKSDSQVPDYVRARDFPPDVEVIYRGWD
ncbi:MAG: hypothetical protein GXO29_06710 [Thermotogae bacterium]|nr:hypothetical protein [Thermotogota bacterium]